MQKLVHLKPLIFIVLLIGLGVVAYHFRDTIDVAFITAIVARFGLLAPLIFILLYSFAVVCFIPGAILTVAGGFIFGPIWGTLYNLIGAVTGASVAFIIARYLAADWVTQRAGQRLQMLFDGVARAGWRFVAFVRLVPLFPFNLLNYALGLTPVSLGAYVIASAVFMLPGTFAYTYLGFLGQSLFAVELKRVITRAFIALGLILLLAAIPWLIKLWQQPQNRNHL